MSDDEGPRFAPVPRNDRHDALEELTTSVRRLVAGVVGTSHDAAALRSVAARVDALADELGDAIDDDPWTSRAYSTPTADPCGFMAITPAIGRSNPVAPVVDLHVGEDGTVAGTVEFGLAHVGPPYRAHGGAVASVLDGLLGIAVIAGGSPGMTTSMTVRYRGATPIRVPLRMAARAEPVDERTGRATGEIYDEDGNVTAEAEATFVRPRTAR